MQRYYTFVNVNNIFVCLVCHQAKQRKLPFPLSSSHALDALDLLHIDVWSPCSTTSMHGHRYFFTIVDDHTCYTWVFPMNNKFETRNIITKFILQFENQFQHHVKVVHIDDGNEFLMKDFFLLKA